MRLRVQHAQRAVKLVIAKDNRHAEVGSDVKRLARRKLPYTWIGDRGFDDQWLDRASYVLSEGVLKGEVRSRTNAAASTIVIGYNRQLVLIEP